MLAALLVIALLLLLILVVVLQMAFIRSRIAKLQLGMNEKDVEIDKHARFMVASETKMRMYALVLDLDASMFITSASSELTESIKRGYSTGHSLPYICEGSQLMSVPVRIDKMAIMVTKDTGGSQALLKDIVAGEVKYIIVAQELYMIAYDPALKDQVVLPYFIDKKDESTLQKLNDKLIFVLHSLGNHTITSDHDIEDCRFAMQPFIGTIRRKGGSDTFLDMRADIIGGKSLSASVYPIHVIGYTA